jgi:hypothetical protein
LVVSLYPRYSPRICEAGNTWSKLRLKAMCLRLPVMVGLHRNASWRQCDHILNGRMSVIHDRFHSVWCILVVVWLYIKLHVNISNSIFLIDLERLPRILALFVMAYCGLHHNTTTLLVTYMYTMGCIW